MMRKFLIRSAMLLLTGSLIISGCKTAEKIPEAKLRPISSSRLLRNVADNAFDYQYFNVRRIQVTIDDGESRNSFRATMQAAKDRQILISITKFNIPLGRISLTPDSIIFVNFLERSYIADNYRTLSDLFNFDVDFNTVQTILSGNIFSFFDDEDELRDYNSYTDGGMYIIQSEKYRKLRKIEEKGKTQKMERIVRRSDEDALIVHTFQFDPMLFVLRRMALEDKTNQRNVDLRFSDYERIDSKYYPGSIDLLFLSEEGKFRLDMKMAGFSTERSEFLPLRIPEKYQRLYLN